MRLANSCCFSGGADGTQGSFKSMPGMATRAMRAVKLSALACFMTPLFRVAPSADPAVSTPVFGAEVPFEYG
jgi:hypothetical protein